MALSDDQRAMLQLLLERGQTYDDLASMLGTDRADVRRRARAALTELAGEDPDESVALTDYLLGEADPIARADAIRHLQGDPDALSVADDLATKLRLIAPDAELPELPRGKKAPRAAAPRAGDGGGPSRISQLSTRQSRIYVAIGASAILLVVAVLAIAGVFSGGGSDTSTAADSTGGGNEGAIPFTLKPQNGSDARGQAALGFASTQASNSSGQSTDQPYLDLRLENLPDAPSGQAYVVWFMINDKSGFPLPAALPVKNGKFSQQLAIPAAVYSIIAQMRFLSISLADSKGLASDIQDAIKSGQGVLQNNGQTVLSGEIPSSVAASAPAPTTTGSSTTPGAATPGATTPALPSTTPTSPTG
jgi:hypothetical protein